MREVRALAVFALVVFSRFALGLGAYLSDPPVPLASSFKTRNDCCANSFAGLSSSALGPFRARLFSRSPPSDPAESPTRIGSRNASVFPLPVGATASRSFPSSSRGTAWRWIGVGSANPASPRRVRSLRPAPSYRSTRSAKSLSGAGQWPAPAPETRMFQRLRATFAASISRDERTDEAASTAEVVFFFARFGGSFSEDLDLVDEPAREASKTSMASSSPLAPRDDSRTARSGAASVAETRFRFFPASAPRPDSTGAAKPPLADSPPPPPRRKSFMSSRWRFPSKRTPPVSEANASAIFALAASDIATDAPGGAPRRRARACVQTPRRGEGRFGVGGDDEGAATREAREGRRLGPIPG